MLIIVPTYQRVGEQKTLDWIPTKWLGRTYLVCPPEEVSDHKSYHKNVVGCPAKGIAPTRQWVIENTWDPHVLFMDDDMEFYTRKDEVWNLREPTEREMENLLERFAEYLRNGWHMLGLSPRQKNAFVWPQIYVDIGRMNNCYAFNAQTLLTHNIRFDDYTVMEDFHVTLEMLRHGYKNRIFYDYAWGQYASNQNGGCSLYRNNELQTAMAERLCQQHAPFVQMVKKISNAWHGEMAIRDDVKISWLKAYHEGRYAPYSSKECERGVLSGLKQSAQTR